MKQLPVLWWALGLVVLLWLGGAAMAATPSIAGGYGHTLALDANGRLLAWGADEQCQLGQGRLLQSERPMRVPLSGVFVKLASGSSHNLALKADGSLWAWGSNGDGQLGNGLFSEASTPQLVINETITDLLDLTPATPLDIPAAALPPFLVKAQKSGELSSLFLSADVHGLLDTDVSRNGRAAGYKVYVAALAGSGTVLNWYQLDAQRRWSGLNWPMAEYLSNVSLNSKVDFVSVEILDGVDVSGLIGSRIYVGYGSDAEEMARAKRYRELMTIPAPRQ